MQTPVRQATLVWHINESCIGLACEAASALATWRWHVPPRKGQV